MNRARASIPVPAVPVVPPVQPVEAGAGPRPGWGWTAALLLLVALAAGYAWRLRINQAAKPAPVAVRSVRVRGGVIQRGIRLTGVTAAANAAVLIAPQLYGSRNFSGGQADFSLLIQELAVPGSFVNKGDMVASFDHLFMSIRLDDHRVNVAGYEAYMRVLTAAFEVRRKAQERKVVMAKGARDKSALNLKTAPVRSAIQSERFRLQLEEDNASYGEIVSQWKWFDDSERSAIRRLELDIKEQRIGLQRAERNLERMEVRAPISGLLVVQSIYRGSEMAEIRKGDQLFPGHVFAQIVDPRSMVVNAEVNQVDAELLRNGQRARVRFDAYPDLELPARVVSVGMFANASGFRRAYVKSIPVRLKLEETDRRVIPNFTVNADVVTASEESASIAPLESVFMDSSDAAPHVYVRTESGWEERTVELGLRNNVEVAVRDGLKAGEVIAAERPLAP
jgi:multidrug efflux pump subunit AcrA (membrane-fusion protein)